MSFEQDWFDVLNHPPHHMARWNLSAYRKLAEIFHVKMRHFAPPTSPFKQALQSFRLKAYGPGVRVSRPMLLKDLFKHRSQFLLAWRSLRERARLHENGGSDLILVEFTAP